jgi:hypothetical protein
MSFWRSSRPVRLRSGRGLARAWFWLRPEAGAAEAAFDWGFGSRIAVRDDMIDNWEGEGPEAGRFQVSSLKSVFAWFAYFVVDYPSGGNRRASCGRKPPGGLRGARSVGRDGAACRRAAGRA